MKTSLDITPSPRLLQVLGQIPLAPWQCVAELVDNSLDELLKDSSRTADDPLVIAVRIEETSGATYLVVSDNGTGMQEDEFERSLRAGHSAKNRYGSLGLFGMGFNIATARLGNRTEVTTTQRGSGESLRAIIDFRDLQKRESFSIPLERETVAQDDHGTVVRVELSREMAKTLSGTTHQRTLVSQLGDIYSFILRDDVPGLTRNATSERVPAVITFNDEDVRPKLPCVWADHRSVPYSGEEICAIQYIDIPLTEATACLSCGFWDRKNGPDACEECGSPNLSLSERRIWGWIGIQRYLDSKRYGIDFIRYGRKILKDDKSIFAYTDPDTLETDIEYPIEMPANFGRIVGEIHLDHVPVTYQKNDFDRNSFDWQRAIELIRGTEPLKTRRAKSANDTPLAKLYSAYRRNDPGLRYLVPGDGNRAIHVKTREWGAQFDKGVPRFQADDEWYESARRHNELKDAEKSGVDSTDVAREWGSSPDQPPAESPETLREKLIGSSVGGAGVAPSADKKAPEERRPQSDIMAEARLRGSVREDLSGTFKLSREHGTWEVEVVVSPVALTDNVGRSVPSVPGSIRGTNIEVIVARDHIVFSEFGRDLRDVALLQSAEIIQGLSKTSASVSDIYAELVQELEDLRETPVVILSRIERTLERIQQTAYSNLIDHAHELWDELSIDHKNDIERRSAVKFAQTPFKEIVNEGKYLLVSGASALAKLIQSSPQYWFDGIVFRQSVLHRTPESSKHIVGTVVRALESLAAFQQDDLLRARHEMRQVQLSLDVLEESLVEIDE